MKEIYFGAAAFLIAAFACGFGMTRLFKKKKPLYFQLLVCAAGCFCLQMLSYIVNLWCGVTAAVSVGMFGIFGCNFFLLSANFGTLDKIVDDGNGTAKARRLAIIAPVIVGALIAATFMAWKDRDMFCAVMWLIMLLPAMPAAYFNLKHILLPMDPFEFLRATRPCNIAALVFYLVTIAYVMSWAAAAPMLCNILVVLVALSVLSLTLAAVKGAEKWGI